MVGRILRHHFRNLESHKEGKDEVTVVCTDEAKAIFCPSLIYVHVNHNSTSHAALPEITIMELPQVETIIKDKCVLMFFFPYVSLKHMAHES